MSFVKKALAEKAEFTPESGYNLVGLDDYGPPEEVGLYLVGHYEDKAAAEAEKAKREKANPDTKYFIYGG